MCGDPSGKNKNLIILNDVLASKVPASQLRTIQEEDPGRTVNGGCCLFDD
jgi:hypothetical protein